MDNSGTLGTNTNSTNQPVSPFAPVDIPNINNVATSGAMPPMNMSPNAGANNQNVGGAASASETMQIPTPPAQNVAAPEVTMANIPEPKVSAEGEAKTPEVPKPAPTAKTQELAGPAEPIKMPEMKPVAEKVPEKKPVEKTVSAAAAGVAAGVAATKMATQAMPSASGVTIEPLLEECIRQNASDLHLEVGLPPTLRIDGALVPIANYEPLDNETVKRLVFATLDEDQQKILLKDKEFDYSFAFGDLGRFRVNAFHEKGNMAAAFRLIPTQIRTIEELGLPGVVSTFADRPNGLVLVTGPTGSGKSTTLAALVDKINSERAVHIITIEDPIEFTHQSKRAMVAQREVHYDTYSFAAALRSILREDPDVVLIGEMRDLETIQAAITVAETGHLVFATLHTNSAAQSIDRMVDVFPAHQQPQVRAQLANILVGICSQRLIPAINGGRVAVAEIMVVNSAVRAIIREGKTHQLDMAIQTGMDQGMQTMDRELAKYVKAGIISYDTAREYAVDTAEFDRLARG